SRFLEKVDPLAGPVAITLDLLRPDAFPEHQRILGMIIDEAGEPVVGAVVGPEGIARGTSTLWGGTTEFTDPLAVSDETGRVVLRCKEGIDFVHARVEGRNVARRWVRLQPGRDHVVRMDEGVLVTGRVEKDGVPQSGIMVGLVTQQRMAGQFIRIEEIATNDDGAFAIPNVPPDQDTVLYGRMDSSRGRGVVESRKFRSMQSGETLRLGALNVRPGHRLAGRVVLSDGRRVPAETRLLLGRDDAWDTAQVILDEDGRFEFLDVPAESVALNLRVRGYKMSKKNPSLDWLSGGLVGRVEKDIDDFVILLEPGEWRRYNRDEGQPPDGDLQP